MVTRFGGPDGKDLVLGDDPENSDAFGHMIVYGYFLIIIVQIIGVVLEEDYNFQVVSHKKEATKRASCVSTDTTLETFPKFWDLHSILVQYL